MGNLWYNLRVSQFFQTVSDRKYQKLLELQVDKDEMSANARMDVDRTSLWGCGQVMILYPKILLGTK